MASFNNIATRLTAWEQSTTRRESTLERIGWDIADLSCSALDRGDEALNDRIVNELESRHDELTTNLYVV